MKISGLVLPILLLTLLVGCVSQETRERWRREKQVELESQARTTEANIERMKNKCDSYGFARGTTAFAQCVQQAEANEEAQRALEAITSKGTPKDPNYWFDKSKCFATGKVDC